MDNNLAKLFDLNGRSAIVTGGLGLLGSEYVKTLARAGAAVSVFDIADKINPTLDELVKQGYGLDVYKVDITDKKQVLEAVEKTVAKSGIPTILINNAGLGTIPNGSAADNGPFEEYPEKAWDALLDSHLKGMFFVSQAVIWQMKKSGIGGSIINISSTYGVVSPDQSIYEFRRRKGENYYKPVAYTVAKAGVLGFTRWLAEYAGPKIRVNTLVPGGVETPDLDPDFQSEYEKRTIAGRMADKGDYNGAILFLASDASAYMTGASLIIDGGWTAL